MRFIIITLLSSLVLFSCQKEKKAELKSLDLLSYGFPISVMAPDSAKVQKSSLGGIIEEVTIEADNFGLLVQSSAATITDIKEIKNDELKDVKDGRFFSKIIREDDAGFLYETAIDSTNVSYEFFYVKIQGDKDYRFRTPYTGTFTEEEAARIYESILPKK